jgi:hypothetical protein
MPRDADYGRELAKRLSALYSGRITNVEFTYDAFLELDRLSESEPYCKISPTLYEQLREGRAIWRESIQLTVTLISAVGATDDGVWVDDWLDSWDATIKQLREVKLFDRHVPLSIDIDERYDNNMFHNNRRLVTQAAIHYGNVEVR